MPNPDTKALTSVNELTPPDLHRLLAAADRLLAAPHHHALPPRPLDRRTVILLFFENSTRTRASFEIAAAALGASPVNLDVETSSTAKGETYIDTIQTLDAMRPDALVVRHRSNGAARLAQRHAACPVINAGSGVAAHPTQALLDALAIRRHAHPHLHLPDATPDLPFAGLRLALIGDILHSRVARSLLRLLPRLGARITLIGPPEFLPDRFATLGHTIAHTLDQGLADNPHIVYTLRVQRERIDEPGSMTNAEYHRDFGITPDRLARLAPDAFLMHPGPVNRGVELSAAALDLPRSLVLDQVEAGVALRKAALLHLLRPECLDALAENA